MKKSKWIISSSTLMIVTFFVLMSCSSSKKIVLPKDEMKVRSSIEAPYLGLKEELQMRLPNFILDFALGFAPHFNPPVPPNVKVHRDIEYTTYQGKSKQLDIYLPPTKGPHPLIVFIHGGGFKMGKCTHIVVAAMEQLNRGYAMASMTYSLSGEAKWPTQMYQIKAAVRWLRANAKEYNLDPDKFIAWGPSAGGTLATVLGTSGDVKGLEDLSLGNSEYSCRVQGVISYYTTSDYKLIQYGWNANPGNFGDLLFGYQPIEYPEKSKSANAITHITSDDPPFYPMHGTSDRVIPHSQSSLLYDGLIKAKLDATFISIPGYAHGDPRFDSKLHRPGIEAFLDKVAGRNTP